MSIEYPELKNPGVSNLHQMIREKCEEYFEELEDQFQEYDLHTQTFMDIEEIFEDMLAGIGKEVLKVHYHDDYPQFVADLGILKKQQLDEEE